MSKKENLSVEGTQITLLAHNKADYISLTDMAKYKNAELTGYVISRWLSTRYTIRFLGAREALNNPDFNVIEFDNIKNEIPRRQGTDQSTEIARYQIWDVNVYLSKCNFRF